MRERVQKKLMFDVSRFRRFRTQKLSARRHIEKQRAHFDLSAGRFSSIPDRFNPSAVHDNFSADQGAVLAGGEPKTRNARDTGERFAAKSKRGNSGKIVRRTDFTCRMSL